MKKFYEYKRNLIEMARQDVDDLKLILLSFIMILINVMVLVLLYYFCCNIINYDDVRNLFCDAKIIIFKRIFSVLIFGILIMINYFATSDILKLLSIRYEIFINNNIKNRNGN